VLVEATIMMPIMIVLIMGALEFSMVTLDHIMLTSATTAGARVLSISRGSTSAYSATTNQIAVSAGSLLTPASIVTTITVNSVTCTGDGDFAVNGNCQNQMIPGNQATVSTTYPCPLWATGALFSNITAGCLISATMTGMVQ
jgi:Flp pilus assembly protein TadG